MIKYIEKNNLDVKIFLMYSEGNHFDKDLSNNIIVDKFRQCVIPGLLVKTVNCFEYIYNNYDFDYIFRTNLSSFIDINGLIKKFKSLPKNKVYGGHSTSVSDFRYISGAGIIFSKDIVKLIIENKKSFNISIIDDVAFGQLLHKFNINIIEQKRKNYFRDELRLVAIDKNENFNDDISNEELLFIYLDILRSKRYHSRFKNMCYKGVKDKKRIIDKKIFDYLTNKFYSL